jgi:hypothetical protein
VTRLHPQAIFVRILRRERFDRLLSAREDGVEPKKGRWLLSRCDDYLRAAWRALVVRLADAMRFVFVGEMGTNISQDPFHAPGLIGDYGGV